MNRFISRALLPLGLITCGVLVAHAFTSLVSQTRNDTNDIFADWRPNSDTRGIRYVGSKACVQCHTKEAPQLHTPMAQALEVAPDCDIVKARGPLTFRNSNYTYQISRRGRRVVYSVTDGVNSISTPILYCFGKGEIGQTYLFKHNDVLYETRVSYFEKLRKLDFTIGHRTSVPSSVEDGLGRAIGADETQQCFSCHTTGAVSGFELKLAQLKPGIGCEACHGPGERHIRTVKALKFGDPQIFNPGKLSAHDLTQSFCGTCHTSFDQAMLMPGQSGINNIRFQPYRIFSSKGHNVDDPRIGCLACHDPHQKLETLASYYDSKCLACHLKTKVEVANSARSASACPVSTKDCVTCHMPKVDLPGMHAEFTDHWIRIVKANEPTPR